MKCPHCSGHYVERHEDLRFEDTVCGSLVLAKAAFDKCDSCGDVLLHPGTGDRVHDAIVETTARLLNRLPVGDFVMARQAAALLGISVQAFSKHRRIQRGFVHQIDLDGHTCYNRASLLLFKRTGDGRFPLATTCATVSVPRTARPAARGRRSPHHVSVPGVSV